MIRNFSLSLSPSLKCLKISILTRRTRARRVSVALKAPRESLRRRHKIRPLKTVKRGAVGSLTRRMHSNPGCSKSLFSNRSLYVSIRSFEAVLLRLAIRNCIPPEFCRYETEVCRRRATNERINLVREGEGRRENESHLIRIFCSSATINFLSL